MSEKKTTAQGMPVLGTWYQGDPSFVRLDIKSETAWLKSHEVDFLISWLVHARENMEAS